MTTAARHPETQRSLTRAGAQGRASVAMEIYYMYAKTRKEFGRHARFDDEPCEVRTRCRRAPFEPRPGVRITG